MCTYSQSTGAYTCDGSYRSGKNILYNSSSSLSGILSVPVIPSLAAVSSTSLIECFDCFRLFAIALLVIPENFASRIARTLILPISGLLKIVFGLRRGLHSKVVLPLIIVFSSLDGFRL